MQEISNTPTATRIGSNLVLTLPRELGPAALAEFRKLVLDQTHGSRALAVIFDCSSVHYMDRHEFAELCAISRIVTVLGSHPCFAGLRPGIVKYLVQVDADFSGVQAFLDLNAALDHFSDQNAVG